MPRPGTEVGAGADAGLMIDLHRRSLARRLRRRLRGMRCAATQWIELEGQRLPTLERKGSPFTWRCTPHSTARHTPSRWRTSQSDRALAAEVWRGADPSGRRSCKRPRPSRRGCVRCHRASRWPANSPAGDRRAAMGDRPAHERPARDVHLQAFEGASHAAASGRPCCAARCSPSASGLLGSTRWARRPRRPSGRRLRRSTRCARPSGPRARGSSGAGRGGARFGIESESTDLGGSADGSQRGLRIVGARPARRRGTGSSQVVDRGGVLAGDPRRRLPVQRCPEEDLRGERRPQAQDTGSGVPGAHSHGQRGNASLLQFYATDGRGGYATVTAAGAGSRVRGAQRERRPGHRLAHPDGHRRKSPAWRSPRRMRTTRRSSST